MKFGETEVSVCYTEACLLQLYRDMFGKKYNPLLSEEELEKQHLSLQRIVYFAERPWGYGIYIGDYGFIWDRFGPFSSQLDYALRGFDKKIEDIKDFYKIDADVARNKLFVLNGRNYYQDKLEIIKTNCPEGYPLEKWLYFVTCMYYICETLCKRNYDSAANEFMYRTRGADKEILPLVYETCKKIENYNYSEYHKNNNLKIDI